MRTVSAIDVRKRFGEIVDQAAAGERIVIERAGHPLVALVPLSDLAQLDPDERRRKQLAAVDEMRRRARRLPRITRDAAALVRQQRDDRAAQILGVAESPGKES